MHSDAFRANQLRKHIMYVILSTGSLYLYSLPEVFQIAKNACFDGIEMLIGGSNCNIEARSIQELSDEYEVPILSLHSPFVICDGWGGFWDRIWRSVAMAMELSIPLVNFHPPAGFIPRHHLNDGLSRHVKYYKDMLKDSDTLLTIENLPTIKAFRRLLVNRYFPCVINNMYQIAEFAADNDLMVTLDTTHIGTTGVDLLEAYAVFKDRIANIHLSDYDGRSEHLLPGKGYLPLKKLLTQIKRDGYNGLITLETSPVAMEHEDRAKVLQNAKASLSYIKNVLNSVSE